MAKNIPVMSELGRGSSEAAPVLKFFSERDSLDFAQEKLYNIALSFGADCPFFMKNRPALVSRVGTEFLKSAVIFT
jgi:4-diphosphocytidyl-2-C-methyl-D-erythritol kinase